MLDKSEIRALLLPLLEKREYRRRSIKYLINSRVSRVVGWMLVGVIVILLTGSLYGINKENSYYLFVSVGIAIVWVYAVYAFSQRNTGDQDKQQEELKQEIKKNVFQQVFRAYNQTLEYRPKEAIAEENFKTAELYKNYSQYDGEDYGVGQLEDGRFFHFSELWVQQKASTLATRTVFEGLFFIIEEAYPFGKFKERLQISSTGLLPKVAQKAKNKKSSPRAYNENILDADLNSLNEQEAPANLLEERYAISCPSLENPERYLSEEFCSILNGITVKIDLSFYDGMVYMAFPNKIDFWDINIKNYLTDKKNVDLLVQNFHTTFDLLERLARATS